jgi:FMN phosphatase YigB (HAD superfamily)
MPLKAILFDLDDTLLDWSKFNGDWAAFEIHHLRRVFDYVCADIHPLSDLDAFANEFRSRTREAWRAGRGTLVAPHLGTLLVETAAALGAPRDRLTEHRCLEVYGWGVVPGTTAFPEAVAMLKLFKDNNVKVGIITNAYQPMWLRDIELRELGLLDYFPACRISAADVGYLKPHPAIFEGALQCLGTNPQETVFVGDNPIADIAGAQGAGLQAILRVAHPTPPMLSGLIIPDGAINTLNELPGILDTLYPGWRAQPQ